MSIKLSKKQISTFTANIVTLSLTGETDLSKADIKWETSDSNIVHIRDFSKNDVNAYGQDSDTFNDRVLITALNPGNAVITAALDGVEYTCDVNIRKAKSAKVTDTFNHYFGDFHTHSSTIHTRKEFLERTETFPRDVWKSVKNEGFFDSFVVSDHACLVDNNEFYNMFLDAEAEETDDFITFPGCECEVVLIEHDSYGRPHKNAGEIVTFNTPGYIVTRSWDEFFKATSQSPYAISGFAHPQVLGYDTYGMWNFSLKKNTTPQMLKRFKMIEMGNGRDEEDQVLIHETMYAQALDCGYKLAPVSTSDWHFPPWGATCLRGRTIVLAPEKSKEMFLDAVYNARMYATENGNVKLWYTVNGHIPAQTLPLVDTYDFHVDISYFNPPKKSEKTAIVEVISDYGNVVYSKEVDESDSLSLDFTVKSDTARYFYLRLYSTEGDRTWSPAVWTGREFDLCPEKPFEGLKIPKSHMKISSCTNGSDPAKLINNNPREPWYCDTAEGEIVIELEREETVCAIGYWPHEIKRDHAQITEPEFGARFLSGYEFYTSTDGENYALAGKGTMLCHGGEQKVVFDGVNAKYIKLKLLSSIGSASHKPRYKNTPVMIGEIDIYKEK